MSVPNETNPNGGNHVPGGEPVEAPIVPPPLEPKGTPWGPIVGGIAVAGALLGGVWFATSGDSEVDVASADPTEEVAEEGETDETGEESSDGSTEESLPVDDDLDVVEDVSEDFDMIEEEAMFDDMAMDSYYGGGSYYGGSSSLAVWDGEQFVRLTMAGSTWTASTSADGLSWVDSPATGLPEEGYLSGLVEEDGVLVGIVDVYNDRGSSQLIATSTDATVWTTTALPVADGSDSNYHGLAFRDGKITTIRTTYDNSGDPYQILIDAGILTGELQENFCGFDFEAEGGPIGLLVCSYNDDAYPSDDEIDALAQRYDEAETDEEREAIERQLDELWGGNEEVFSTINPGDAVYDAVAQTLFGEFDGGDMSVEVVSGPVSGPFEISSPFAQDGYVGALVQTDSGLFVSFDNYDDRTGSSNSVILASSDGISWSEVGAPPASQGGSLQGFADVLFFMSYSETGATSSFISTDGAVTWTESPLESSLFEIYTEFAAGDAGVVSLTNGYLEPYSYQEPVFEGPETNPSVTKDGFTLELGWFDGSLTLTGPDGLVISLTEADAYEGESDEVRMNPISGALTFLDSETGEALITFTEDDFASVYESFEEEFYGEEIYQEPARGAEVHFSVDGLTWTELDSSALNSADPHSYTGFVGVGDDEAVFFIETYIEVEPSPDLFLFEEEGREPTESEIEALMLWEQGQSETEYIRIPLG